MVKAFDDFADDKTLLGIGLKYCDAHGDDAKKSADGDFESPMKAPRKGLIEGHSMDRLDARFSRGVAPRSIG